MENTGTETSEVERLREEVRAEHDMYLRALADFDNFRRRVERDRSSLAQSGKREILLSLLDLLDGFDRALAHAGKEPSPVYEGIQAIHRQLLNLLESQGVKSIETRGELFNPELHEAIGSVENEDVEPGTIVDEVQRGYRWGDELLRPARVRVAQ
jgi:molecular chaperone GrpE